MKDKILEHVLYEMEMFLYSFDSMQKCEKKQMEINILKNSTTNDYSKEEFNCRLQLNLFYECFLLHTRTLIEFFKNIPSKKDDIVVGTIFIDPSSIVMTKTSSEAHKFIDKTVSHLTLSRTKIQDMNVLKKEVVILFPELVEKMKLFINELNNYGNLKTDIAKEIQEEEITNYIRVVKYMLGEK